MTYRVRVARTAARQLAEQLPEAVAAAPCVEFLYGPLAEDPHHVGAPLRKPSEGYWRTRRGSTESSTPSMTASRTVQILIGAAQWPRNARAPAARLQQRDDRWKMAPPTPSA